MFSRRKRNQRKTNFITKKKVISFFILLFTLLIFFLLSNYVFSICRVRYAFAKQMSLSEDKETVFSLNKIVLYSSADAIRNETQRAIWDLNLYQYTDIAVYLNTSSENGTMDKNTIEKLWIDSISFVSPEQGTPNLNTKRTKDFGKFTFSEDNKIVDSISYTLQAPSSELPEAYNVFYTDTSLPLTLEYTNLVKENFIQPTKDTLTFNGTLLKKASIALPYLEANVSFTIHIINKEGKEFFCNVSIPILSEEFENNTEITTNGFVKQELPDLSHYVFYEK